MKRPVFNPYLPSWEFVPDGEPHVFGNRLYVYGSHDEPGGTTFCPGDYVVWSAPVDDLSDWRCEGVSYRKEQDPLNGAPYDGVLPQLDPFMGTLELPHLLYAPDVACGPDGRYYLYYSLDFTNVISVAVGDSPAGPFEFLDYVRTAEGVIPDVGRWFDPAILCEESGNYLYYGFAPAFRFPGMGDTPYPGAMMVRLADDMHTILSEPVCVANGIDTCKGTCFEAHPFFEASSIRKLRGRYYFVYSSLQGNELCYAVSDAPGGPFVYGGVIHSNGDLGYKGNTLPVTYTGNNHGGLVEIGGEVYIFGHRQTHGTGFSRQGVAEHVTVLPDGSIPQVEITSCGLNGGPLPAKGAYESYIACHLTERDRTKVGHVLEPGPGIDLSELPPEMPYITEEEDSSRGKGTKPYIANLREGAVAGFKYLSFDGTEAAVELELRGCGSVSLTLDAPDGPVAARLRHSSEGWVSTRAALAPTAGIHALYVTVTEGRVDFAAFSIF